MKNFEYNMFLDMKELGRGSYKTVYEMNDFYVLKVYHTLDYPIKSCKELSDWDINNQGQYKLCDLILPEELVGYWIKKQFGSRYYPVTKQLRVKFPKFPLNAYNLRNNLWYPKSESTLVQNNYMISDLRQGNIGMLNGNLKIIDYVWEEL